MRINLIKVILLSLALVVPLLVQAEQIEVRIPEQITEEQYLPLVRDVDAAIKAADAGDIEKQFILGMMYMNGQNVVKNPASALKYLDLAAQNDYVPAELNLAALYFAGAIVERDEKKAMDLINKIDAKNDPQLWLKLSDRFESGDINKKDQTLANEYLTKAANAGNVDALKKLSYMYRTGTNTQKNLDQAIALYEKMYQNPDEKIKREAALLLIGLYSSPTEGVSDNQKMVQWLKNLAVDVNDVTSQLRLGYIYRDGKEVPRDYKEALSWFEKAMKNGNAEAQMNIGYFYGNGLGVKKDYAKAKEYYYNAALAGNAEAAYYMAKVYAEGYGVEKNEAEATKWRDLYARLSHRPENKE